MLEKTNNAVMLKHLQVRADDLAECLLVLECELRSRILDRRLGAVRDLERVENLIEGLRQNLEDLTQMKLAPLVMRLDKKVSSIRCSEAYRRAAWIESADLHWYVGSEAVDPISLVTFC
jgi:hypothetical protein